MKQETANVEKLKKEIKALEIQVDNLKKALDPPPTYVRWTFEELVIDGAWFRKKGGHIVDRITSVNLKNKTVLIGKAHLTAEKLFNDYEWSFCAVSEKWKPCGCIEEVNRIRNHQAYFNGDVERKDKK